MGDISIVLSGAGPVAPPPPPTPTPTPTPAPTPSPGLTAPVLTQTSAPNASPFTWDTTVDATVFAGMFWHLQVATDVGFSSVTQDFVQIIGADDLAGSVTFAGFVTWTGLAWLRLRIEVNDGTHPPGDALFDGTYSAWTAIAETIA